MYVNSSVRDMKSAPLILAFFYTRYWTGYSKFFDASDTNCDTTTWHWWLNITGPYLQKPMRQLFNNLVNNLNDAIKEAIERGTQESNVIFVDYDYYVGKLIVRPTASIILTMIRLFERAFLYPWWR